MAPKCISHKVIFSISAVHQHPIGSSLITSGIVLDPLLDKVITTLPQLLIEICLPGGQVVMITELFIISRITLTEVTTVTMRMAIKELIYMTKREKQTGVTMPFLMVVI